MADGDPRSLEGEEYVPEQDLSERKADISKRLSDVNTKLLVFETPGWALIAEDLRADVNAMIQRLVEGPVSSMEELRNLQGQLAAARSVIDLPKTLQRERDECIEQLRQVQSTEQGEQEASP